MQKLVHNGLLSVSDTGHVYKVMKDGRLKELAQHGISRGRRYLCVRPSINGKQVTFYVHRLVAEAFLHNPKNLPQVNHIDGNPRNNNIENLEWCTASHNIRHAYNTGLINVYRQHRVCSSCGSKISDNSGSGLCCLCRDRLLNEHRFNQNLLLLGVIEFNKKVFGVSNGGLAEMTGYSKETIDSFMAGKRITHNVAKAICDVFQIDKSLIQTELYTAEVQ